MADPGKQFVTDVVTALRGERLRQGLTQEALGERAGIGAAEVSKYESGRRAPTLETVGRLCSALGVSLEAVLAKPVGNEFGREVARVQELGGEAERVAAAVLSGLVRTWPSRA